MICCAASLRAPVRKDELHMTFHEKCPQKCQVGKRLSAACLELVLPHFLAQHHISNKERLSLRQFDVFFKPSQTISNPWPFAKNFT